MAATAPAEGGARAGGDGGTAGELCEQATSQRETTPVLGFSLGVFNIAVIVQEYVLLFRSQNRAGENAKGFLSKVKDSTRSSRTSTGHDDNPIVQRRPSTRAVLSARSSVVGLLRSARSSCRAYST